MFIIGLSGLRVTEAKVGNWPRLRVRPAPTSVVRLQVRPDGSKSALDGPGPTVKASVRTAKPTGLK